MIRYLKLRYFTVILASHEIFFCFVGENESQYAVLGLLFDIY